jgi:arginase
VDLGRSPIRLLEVPYDSGQYGVRMGAVPLALAAGADRQLRDRGHTVQSRRLLSDAEWNGELVTAFALHRIIAEEVTAAHDASQVPVLLSGNCNATLGVLAGLAASVPRLGLVWFDAHGDFNTPDTDRNGFLDGQGVAMITGRCWTAATASVPGFRALADEQVVLIGTRDLDSQEAEALRGSQITVLTPDQARDIGTVDASMAALAGQADGVHIHIDLDVFDPSIAAANSYAAPHGLFPDEVSAVLRQAAQRLPITSATLSAWDPSHDHNGHLRNIALELIQLLAEIARPLQPRLR